jgi:anti-sigma B factor antagonist
MPDAKSRLLIQTDAEKGATIIEFLDKNILDEANIQQIGDEIAAVIDQSSHPKLILSFENVDHLSSAALGTLITINNKIKAKDGQLRLANIDPQIYEVFTITRLNKLFQMDKTTDEALKNIK